MNKHTPGPWSVNEENYEFEVHSGKLSVEAEDYFIAQVDEGLCQEANARLIAAAPDLLEALEYVADIDVSGADDSVVRFILAAAQHKARAAIGRARGEA